MKKEIDLMLYPYTFLWINSQSGIIYNSMAYSIFNFKLNPEIEFYCRQLMDTKNLYITHIKNPSTDITNWINEIITRNMGCLIKEDDLDIAVGFPPILNLQADVKRINEAQDRSMGEFASQNFNEISIYIGGISDHSEWYRQIPYPITSKDVLNFYDLKTFLLKYDSSYLNTINIIGDIPSYNYENDLIELLNGFYAHKHIFINSYILSHSTDWTQRLDIEKTTIWLYYESKMSIETIKSYLFESDTPIKLVYPLLCDGQWKELERLKKAIGDENIIVKPIFQDNNKFFEDNIYVNEDDFLGLTYDKQDIFAHQVMNTNFWGRLHIFPNGNVYSNVNHLPIGTLKNNLYDLIIEEMNSRRSWRWTRDCIPECKECLYHYLCPSPSNYELVIGKYNLCHIWDKRKNTQ